MTLSLERTQLSAILCQQHNATWQDYCSVRDNPDLDWRKLAFHEGWLRIEMGTEGPNHARFSDLLTAILFVWAFLNPDVVIESFGRCLIEKPETQACAPDLILYRGKPIPQWQPGEPRRIDLTQHRIPDLVGEISDTTLAVDLDEQKRLYAKLGIAEYWVIDVKGMRLFAFALGTTGDYAPTQISQVLTGLPISLVEQTLERLATETNTAAANWLMQQLQTQDQSNPSK